MQIQRQEYIENKHKTGEIIINIENNVDDDDGNDDFSFLYNCHKSDKWRDIAREISKAEVFAESIMEKNRHEI